MPVMNVQYLESSLDVAQKADIAKRLTDLLITMEGGANTEGGRAFATVIFDEIKTGDWYVGGVTGDQYVSRPGRFIVHVTLPEGYMNIAHKTEVHAGVNAAIVAALGAQSAANAGASILVVIDEVPEGNWGARGKTISIASIAGTVGLSKASPRFEWVQSYFAAKGRQFKTAGYPTDASGLLPPDA